MRFSSLFLKGHRNNDICENGTDVANATEFVDCKDVTSSQQQDNQITTKSQNVTNVHDNTSYFRMTPEDVSSRLLELINDDNSIVIDTEDAIRCIVQWYDGAIRAMVLRDTKKGSTYVQESYDKFNSVFFCGLCMFADESYLNVNVVMHDVIEEIMNLDFSDVFFGEKEDFPNVLKISTFFQVEKEIINGDDIVANILESYMKEFLNKSESEQEIRFLKAIEMSFPKVGIALQEALESYMDDFSNLDVDDCGDFDLSEFEDDTCLTDSLEHIWYISTPVLIEFIPRYFPEMAGIAADLDIATKIFLEKVDCEVEITGEDIVSVLEFMDEYKMYHCPGIEFEYPKSYWKYIIYSLIDMHDGVATERAREILVSTFNIPAEKIESLMFNLIQDYISGHDENSAPDSTICEGLMADPFMYKVLMMLYPPLYNYFSV